MLEYFTYKKFKKNKAEKEEAAAAAQQTGTAPTVQDDHHDVATESTPIAGSSTQHHTHKEPDELGHHHAHIPHIKTDRSSHDEPLPTPVLDKDDESWLRDLLADDGPAPPLPPRPKTPEIEISSDSDAASTSRAVVERGMKSPEDQEDSKDKKKKDKKEKKEKEKEKGEKHPNRLSLLFTRNKKHGDTLKPEDDVPPKEAEREKKDLSSVLDRLQLSAMNNKVVSLSNESSELLQRFTQVFKDLVNGVPTAYGDLTSLIDDRDGAINRGFEKLPSSLQKLVTQLPDKLTASLAPELLAAAAESQGLKASAEGNVMDQAKRLMMPQNLAELVTKPGAIVSMLKAIVNALKVRWPAFMGTNVLWSVALFCKSSPK